jgi:acyl transferase domain-containing protein
MKKSVLLFPGTDALEDPRLRVLCLQIPEVRYKLRVAQEILNQSGYKILNLLDFMRGPNNSSPKYLMALSSATVAVQVALFDKYLKEHKAPDMLLGCSMGDAAKSISLGAVDFATGLINMTNYISEILKVSGGAVLKLKLKATETIRTGRYVLPEGLYWSVLQTPRHALVGGDLPRLFAWAKSLDPIQGEAQMMYPFPLHTPLMEQVAKKFDSVIENSVIKNLNYLSLSTVTLKNITTKNELIDDLKSNVTKPVRWWEATQELVKLGYSEFVNLGPSPTLLKFNKYIFESGSIVERDYFLEALKSSAASLGNSKDVFKDAVVI